MLKRLYFIFFLLPLACIEPYQVELPEGKQLLTVDGFVTTEPGPHKITLTRSDTYGSVFEGLIRPVSQASVAIRDSEGTVTLLTETEERGVYETPAEFRTQLGLSYSLLIELQNGNSYTSLPEKVEAVPEIESLSYRAVRTNTSDRLNDRIGIQIFSQFRDPGDQTNFYYWRQSPGSFVLVTNPEQYTLPPNHPTNPRGPAPKDCCATCYISEQSRLQRFSLASDREFNGLSQNIPIAFIEDDGLRFKRTYRAEIQQMGVSQNAHRFLRLVEQQISLTGGVFDQPPANIRGNIISLDDPDDIVLGYFIAASVSKKTVYIQRDNLEFAAQPRIIPDDCLTVIGATLSPPRGWNP